MKIRINRGATESVTAGATAGATFGAAGGPLASVAGAGIGAGVGLLGNLLMSSIEQENYVRNQQRNFELGQRAQREAGTNQKISMQNAGISPAAMLGGDFSPAAIPNSPLQNKALNVDAMAGALAGQEIRLKAAQADQQEIVNNRMRDEDIAYNEGMTDQFKAIIKQFNEEGSTDAANVYQAMLDGMKQRGDSFTKGSFDGWNNAIKMIGSANEQTKRFYQERFESAVIRQKLNTPEAIDAQAMFGKGTYDKLLAEISKIDIDKAVAVTTAQRNTAEVLKVSAQLGEIQANVSKLLSESAWYDVNSDAKYHSDFAAMVRNGDYGQAATAFTASVLQDIIPAVVTKGKSVPNQVAKGQQEANVNPTTIRDANRPLILGNDGKPKLIRRKDGTYTTVYRRSSAFPQNQ